MLLVCLSESCFLSCSSVTMVHQIARSQILSTTLSVPPQLAGTLACCAVHSTWPGFCLRVRSVARSPVPPRGDAMACAMAAIIMMMQQLQWGALFPAVNSWALMVGALTSGLIQASHLV